MGWLSPWKGPAGAMIHQLLPGAVPWGLVLYDVAAHAAQRVILHQGLQQFIDSWAFIPELLPHSLIPRAELVWAVLRKQEAGRIFWLLVFLAKVELKVSFPSLRAASYCSKGKKDKESQTSRFPQQFPVLHIFQGSNPRVAHEQTGTGTQELFQGKKGKTISHFIPGFPPGFPSCL